ncbi:MAG: hypothetical protein DWQ54_14220 [Microcystis flos-aquae TF09]|uniref:Peptidase M15A C-terminal domain-containing protein n=1 Tax=Microcystis flos-aquae TF09 TaxID=2060473 RepID=A0A3E0L3X6_9CHRO|nr:MAG: hypothetical protein DWQ54_14220 [Microcystis flos-aquae TF09]
MLIGKYLTLEELSTCSQTYQKYASQIDPYPKNPATITAWQNLAHFIIDPIIDNFGREKFQLTYGFCSNDLRKFLQKKDPITGLKNGRIDPSRDQHCAHEINQKGQYYCQRLGAACDFRIINLTSDRLIDWILNKKLPFDSLYFYGINRPIHISYGPQHKRDLWTFTPRGTPTKKGLQSWLEAAKSIDSEAKKSPKIGG